MIRTSTRCISLVAALASTLGGASACTPAAPTGPLVVPVLEANGTFLTTLTDPFGLETGAGHRTRAGDRDCAPIAVALRAFEDDGSTYHRPDRPRDDLVWLRSGRVVTARQEIEPDDGRVHRAWSGFVSVELLDDDGAVQALANVQLSAGAESFMDVDITVPFRDRDVALVTTCWQLDDDEHAVGGGERFDGADLAGRTVPISFNVGGYASGTNEAHAPVPFIATSHGLALYVETERPLAFDVGDSQVNSLIVRIQGNHLPLRVRTGSMFENIVAHARRMGLPPVPPRWVLAPQQWRNEHSVDVENDVVTSSGRDKVHFDADFMRANDIPTTALWIDAPWSTGHNTFQWNESQFPDPAAMLQELDDQGYRVIVWATEHLNKSDDQDQMYGMPAFGSLDLFQEFEDDGYLVRNANDDDAWTFPWGRGLGGYLDFTNRDAVAAYQDLMRPLVQSGIRGFKLDYGEMMRPELLGLVNDTVRFSDGSLTSEMHTRYARLYHEAFLEVLREEHPDDWYVITRTGGIFDQQNGVTIWPGDLDNDWLPAGAPDPDDGDSPAVGGLPAAIQGGLSLAMSGYPLYGSDIGGYRGGTPTHEVLMRWTQFGAVSTVMQLGGAGSHNPWDTDVFPPEAVDIYRRYARLHMDLLPTWEALLFEASFNGFPVVRPLGIVAPDDQEAWADVHTFLVGNDLLAAPVVEEGATTRTLRLPEGTWVGWWSNDVHEGPATITVDAPLDTLPLFQRAGAAVVVGHPLLATAVSAADPTVHDYDELGDVRIARVARGADSSVYTEDVHVAAGTAEGFHVRIEAFGEPLRRLGIEYRLTGAEISSLTVSVNDAAPTEVTDADALWACSGACVLREVDRVLIFGAPSEILEATFTP